MAKHKLFGGHIQPNCAYCCHNCTPDEEKNTCDVQKHMGDNGKCPGFAYNPLLRKPESLPPMRHFGPEDFQL